MLTILTEKPSAGRNFAKALGGMQGNFNSGPEELLRLIDRLLLPNLDTMRKNKEVFLARFGRGTEGFGSADKAKGIYKTTGESVVFKKSYAGHMVSDKEIEALLSGKTITIDYVTKAGVPAQATGSLGKRQYKGNKFWKFKTKR